MTKQRYDKHSTEFGLWLREQNPLDSSKGYIATNIDYIWCNYKTRKYVLIEEKRYMSEVKKWQESLLKLIDCNLSKDKNYHGFYLIQFENTSPEDGSIYLNGKEISRPELIEFLQLNWCDTNLKGGQKSQKYERRRCG